VTHQSLAKLLKVLEHCHVKHFKNKFLEVELFASEPANLGPSPAPDKPLPDHPQSTAMKVDDTMSFDEILNWSAPPGVSSSTPPLPLTGGDQPA
jgi:hypothetical protein